MKASEFEEVQMVARSMQHAAVWAPAYNPFADVLDTLRDEMHRLAGDDLSSHTIANTTKWLGGEVKAAPTLLKHCEEDEYRGAIREIITQEVLPEVESSIKRIATYVDATLVDLVMADDIDREILATLVYEHSHYPFRAVYRAMTEFNDTWIGAQLGRIASVRGQHDELPRAFRAEGGLIFDIHMDIGGMRDLHRHRRCTQIFQGYTADEWAVPEGVNLPVEFKHAMHRAQVNFNIMQQLTEVGSQKSVAPYILPLGMKRRFLMKMDTAEVDYIAELRTKPAGHIAYRRVAWEMFKCLQRVAPGLAAGIEGRVTDPDAPIDIFDR